MPGIARKNIDIAGGVAIEGSQNVFVNGIGVVRAGDKANCNHNITGSSNVSVN